MTMASTVSTASRRLAASPRPIAEVLIDAVRRASLPSRGGEDRADDRPEQLALRIDDETEPSAAAAHAGPSLEEVLAAVVVGRAFEADRAGLAELQDPDKVTIVEVPDPAWTEPVAAIVSQHVIGTMRTMGRSDLHSNVIVAPGTVAMFKQAADSKHKHSDEEMIARAVQRRCAILVVASDPDRYAPPAILRLADRRISIPPLDPEALAAVIETVTGRRPGMIDAGLAAGVTLADLKLAVRADLGAEVSHSRLKRLVEVEQTGLSGGPRLADLAGLGPAKDWGLSVAADLRAYEAGHLDWAEVDRGCVLTGAPGTGKTSFARALAREANVHFTATSYSQWQAHRDGHLGHVTQAIRNAFSEAQLNAPSILFIDEIDSIPTRGRAGKSDDWWTAITNTLLECLDGYERREGVVVIAACNDPSRLDPALVRSGRLDRRIDIPLPDVTALIGIFRTHLGHDLQGADLRAPAVAARGKTGADVERFVREARSAARRAGAALTVAHLIEAVRGGEPDLPPDLRRRLATHEAGHAVAMLALGQREPVALSINADGGIARSVDTELRAETRAHVENHIVMLLAGRAAEELVFCECTAGAGGSERSDLGLATKLAIDLETVLGLGRSGLVRLPTDSARDLILRRDLHDAVQATLDDAYAKARDLMVANRPTLEALATALFETGYLDRAEIDAVVAAHPLARPAQAKASSPGPHADASAAGYPSAPAAPNPSLPPGFLSHLRSAISSMIQKSSRREHPQIVSLGNDGEQSRRPATRLPL
ncbi:MAG: AAA family ATPase [Pseudolabrys sp.]|nr:AAA family ATPase [Pseudolabrys sp.]